MRSANNRITVQQLRYLLKTAETGSVTDAARELGISQSTLSEALSQMENATGFAILARSRKGATPTPLGTEFLHYAQNVVNRMDDLERRFVIGFPSKHNYRIASQSFGFAWEALVELATKPESARHNFTWDLCGAPNVISKVAAEKADVGLIGISSSNRKIIAKLLADNDVQFYPIMTATLFALFNPSHPLARHGRRSVSHEELADYPFFAFDQFVHLELRPSDDSANARSDKPATSCTAYGIAVPNGLMVSPTQLVKDIADSYAYTVWCRVITDGVVHNHVDTWPIDPEERRRIEKLAMQTDFSAKDVVSIPIENEDPMEIGYVLKKGMSLDEIGQLFINSVASYDN